MNTSELTSLVSRMLISVAPDIEGEAIDPARRFSDQFEFDSMDFLNFVTALHRETGLDLPEKDYPRLVSLDKAVAYLAEQFAGTR